MDNTADIIKSLRDMAFLMFRLGDFPKQKTLEAAADRIEALQKENASAIEFIKYLDREYSGYLTEDEKFEKWRGQSNDFICS